ncbi:AraC family transcriptional regulator [Lacibacter luteus]|uniref:AraC family transcriptional regulator n=1 Tax=Lacibacter luteus TaxID=2508719 RepID=A0A4Q1CHB4_9BACT|nr:AraC family transcriptional regulator [Lacibacter luteus]RXK59367.1 AraC family transcriptional regulator [Lacibacter luteus]
MDKLDITQWNQYFGSTQQEFLHRSERYQHFTAQFSEQGLASGTINAINTPGMLFTELFIEAGKPFCMVDAEPKESTESVFVIQGNVESRFDNVKAPLFFGKQQHNIQYNTSFSGTHIIHSPTFHACTITYHKEYLTSLAEQEPVAALAGFCKHLQKKTNFLAASNAFYWQQRIAEVIQLIRQCPFTGVTRYLFIESKLLELFVLQMEQVHATQIRSVETTWSAADKEKLHAVKEYISSSYLDEVSLKALTYRFGLNEYKLKKGYKYLFQTTVFGDIHRLRMQEAKQLLTDRRMNVTDVAFHIGYNNLSSFSYAFKKMFGYNPGGIKWQD